MMHDYPIITVVTPSYNQGAFIAYTIESVIGQGGNFGLDYIIIDGQSTDATIEIIRRYEKLLVNREWPVKCREVSFRWLSEKDNGQADAINKGLAMAHGEVAAWINSDDIYMPGAFQKAVTYLSHHNDVGMLYGRGYEMDQNGKVLREYPTASFSCDDLIDFNPVLQQSVFIRTKIMDSIGPLDTTLHYALDYDLWIRIAKRQRVAYLNDFLGAIRLHADAKTVSDPVASYEEVIRTALKHYGRVGGRYIYGYAYHLRKRKKHNAAGRFTNLFGTAFLSLFLYLKLNRSLPIREIKWFLKNRTASNICAAPPCNGRP